MVKLLFLQTDSGEVLFVAQPVMLVSLMFSMSVTERGLDFPSMGLLFRLLVCLAAADFFWVTDFVGVAGLFLFQDQDDDSRSALEGDVLRLQAGGFVGRLAGAILLAVVSLPRLRWTWKRCDGQELCVRI